MAGKFSRHIRSTVAAAAMVVLLISSVGTARATDPLLLTESVELSGATTVEGNLSVFLQEKTDPTDPFGSPQFLLEADHVRVETDRAEVSGPMGRPLTDTQRSVYQDATLSGLEHRENYLFSLWPLHPEVQTTADSRTCVGVEPSEREAVERPPLVRTPRDMDRADVSEALSWESCGNQSSITIQGDFLLRLWEWDSELVVDGERRVLESGMRNPEPVPPGAPDGSDVVGEAQEQYVYAYNATLRIRHLEAPYQVFMHDVHAEASEGYRMLGATGRFMDQEVQDQEVYLEGNDLEIDLEVERDDRVLQAFFTGGINQAEIDGRSIEPEVFSNPVQERTGAPIVFIGLLAAGLLIISGTVAWHVSPQVRSRVADPLARQRDRWFQDALIEANEYNANQPRSARRWARMALWIQPSHPEALAAVGKAHYTMKRYEKALRFFQDAISSVGGEYSSPEVPDDAIAFWAVNAIQCLSRMRLREADPARRNDLTEQILVFVRMACCVDRDVAETLLLEPTVSDLWGDIRLSLDLNRYSPKQ